MDHRKILAAGAALLLLLQIAASARPFTVAVIPDTQSYTFHVAQRSYWFYPLNGIDFFYAQTEYIRGHAASNGGSIVMALHEGDMVELRSLFPSEWRYAVKAMSLLDGAVPFLVAPGNHDCDKWKMRKGEPTQCLGWSTFVRHFGADSSFFSGKRWYGGSFNGGTSSWSLLSVDGRPLLFLALELEPTDEAIGWAQSVLDLHRGVPTIVVTHEYLTVSKRDASNPDYLAFANSRNRLSEGGNSPSVLWNTLVRKNDQILMVLCGHSFNAAGDGEGMRVDVNDAGHEVYALLANYQNRRETANAVDTRRNLFASGDGWLRLLDFDLDAGTVHVQTYSPYLDRYETDGDSDFTITLGFDWDERFPRADGSLLSSVMARTLPFSLAHPRFGSSPVPSPAP